MSVALSEHHGALSLFAEAIVGEPLPVEPVDDEWWPAAVTDPTRRRVQVPAELEQVDATARRRYRSMVLHQLVGIEERTGIDLDIAGMRRRHPALPAVFAVLEDRRIDGLTRRRYPGSARDLDALLADSARAGEGASGPD